MITLLGIETATAVCSVGITRFSGDGKSYLTENCFSAERSIYESHIHSEKILTLVQELCGENKISLSQLDGIAISIGPGSFTGLRIGLSFAKGLSYSLMKPLIAVPTFQAIAAGAFKRHRELKRVMVCVDAKQGEYYISVFERSDEHLNEIIPVQIKGVSEIFPFIDDKTAIITDRSVDLKKTFPDSLTIRDIFTYCRGDVVAGLAFEKLKGGSKDSLEDLEPLYLKDFIIRRQDPVRN
jgi:tRNA threonylcarbamoyladenosine biosynthesis protein TsaB